MKHILHLALGISIWSVIGCSASNDMTFTSFKKNNPNVTPPVISGPSPSGPTVFRISTGAVSGSSTDSSTIQAAIIPLKKTVYNSSGGSIDMIINAKRLNQ